MFSPHFRNRIHRKLLEFGWLVMRVNPAPGGWLSGRTYFDPRYISRLGFRPRTLVDVGVGQGTPPLYDAFPEPYLVLIEPLAEFDSHINAILARRDGELVRTALGHRDETCVMLVEPHYTERSSIFARAPIDQTGDSPQPRDIPVTTLDSLQSKHHWNPPFGLKIDTEGCELDVVRGAREFMRETLFVIVEVNVLNRFPGSYRFAEFIAAMDEVGFELCDILDIARTSATDVNFVDLIFRNSHLES